jgi:hypothetical protein
MVRRLPTGRFLRRPLKQAEPLVLDAPPAADNGAIDDQSTAESNKSPAMPYGVDIRKQSARNTRSSALAQSEALSDAERAYLAGLFQLQLLGLDEDLQHEAAQDLALKFVEHYGEAALRQLQAKIGYDEGSMPL